jgi:ATP-binding cassette subfamily B protein
MRVRGFRPNIHKATAYADPENEHLMQKALSVLMKGKTVIIIAHRLSTIQKADSILVMKSGRIIESGTHERLLAQKGLYANMWDAYQDASAWVLLKKGEVEC